MMTPAGICWRTASSRPRAVSSSLEQGLALALDLLPLGDLVLQLGLLAQGLRGAAARAVPGRVHHVAEGGDREPDAEVGTHRHRVVRGDR